MDIFSLILNNDMGGLLITLAGQSILISLIGLIVLKLLSKRSAPVRSLVCSATLIALGLTLVLSIGFYIKGISWSQATLPFITEDNTKNSILMPPVHQSITYNEIKTPPLKVLSHTPVEKNIQKVAGPAPGISPHSAPFVLPVFPLSNIAGLIWLAGILFQMVRLGYGIIIVKKFRNNLRSCKNDNYDKMLQAVAGRFWKKRLPKLYSSPLIKSPVTIGIFNPVVIIPQRLSSIITENEMKSILLHELAHIYHYDQVAGIFKRFVIAFHWWNPFVYLINRLHEETREEVSDNYVLGELQPKVYSQCLMDLTKKVCLISSYPTAVGMAGRHFNLRKRVEQILSKKRSIAMGTKLHLKITGFSICLVLTFGIAGLHARGSAVKNDDPLRVSQEPLQVINSVSVTKGDQNLTHINLSEPEAVDVPDKLQSIPKQGTIPQKELSGKLTQKSEKPVMVMASVDMKAINRTEELIESVSVQPSAKPALLTQNKTAEKHDSKASAIPDKRALNNRTEDAANDSKKEDIDTAIAELSRQIELNDSDAGLYVLRGNSYMDKQDYKQAVSDYTKAIEINPDDAAAYNNRGQAYVNMWKEYSYWRQVYKDRWEEYSYRIQNYEKMGRYFRYTNKGEFTQILKDDKQANEAFKKALKDFKKAIKKNPENIYAYINRGNAYYASQKYTKAIRDYTRAIKIDPESSLAYINRGIAHLQDGNLGIRFGSSSSKAIKDFSKALELNNRDAETYLLRGDVYNNKRKYRQAINDYNKALGLNPYLINAYNNCGMAYESMGEFDKAILEYSRAIEIISKNPDAFINHYTFSKEGKTHNDAVFYVTTYRLAKKHTDAAIRRYRVTYILTPEVLSADYMVFEPRNSYILRGLAYEKNNQLDKSISDFSRVIEQNPEHCLGYKYRSDIYRKMGNEVEYKKDLKMAENYGYKIRPTTEYRYGTPYQGYWEGSPDDAYYQRREAEARAQADALQYMTDQQKADAMKEWEAKKAERAVRARMAERLKRAKSK